MALECRFYLVVDPDDDVETERFLRAIHAPRAGRVVCHARVASRHLYALAWDILRSLGKRPNQTGAVRNERELWNWVAAWLVAAPTKQLLVTRAHLLGSARWRSLITLASEIDADLWMCVQTRSLTRTQKALLAEWPVEEVSLGRFRRRFAVAARDKVGEDEPVQPPFPTVPTVEFPLFRAYCRRLLNRGEFAAVDEAFVTTLAELRSPSARRKHKDEGAVAEELLGLVRRCASPNEALTRMRAAQAALMTRFLVKVDPELLGSLEVFERRLTPAVAQALRAYASPRYPAAAAIWLATDLTPAAMVEIRLDQIAPDGTTVTLPDGSYPIAAFAGDLLRAQRLDRLAVGASGDEPLFVTERKTLPARRRPICPLTVSGMQNTLRRVSVETGAFALPHWTPRRSTSARDALRRAGITIQPL